MQKLLTNRPATSVFESFFPILHVGGDPVNTRLIRHLEESHWADAVIQCPCSSPRATFLVAQ